MNFLTKLFRSLQRKPNQSRQIDKQDIEIKQLIESVHQDLKEANESLAGVGIKYIEQYFEREVEPSRKKKFEQQCHELAKTLLKSDEKQRQQAYQQLTRAIDVYSAEQFSDTVNYRPKMTTFNMPVLQNGVWGYKPMTVPLFTLSPIAIPKIKEFTFSSVVTDVKQKGEQVFVRFDKGSHPDKAKPSGNETEVKISFSPEQSLQELKQVIAQFKQQVTPKK